MMNICIVRALLFKQCKVGIVNADDEHIQTECWKGIPAQVESLWLLHEKADLTCRRCKANSQDQDVLGVDYHVTGD